ncbi:MAG: FAD:protein FMN transferase [Enterobacterales bacterium]|nr:FAD:protein FMN transferase [Enterobacterales bacterium]
MFLALLLTACEDQVEYHRLNGLTMGTSYQVTLQIEPQRLESIKQYIDQKLEKINGRMSTYLPNSEISLFNRTHKNDCQKVSSDTFQVVKTSLRISKETDGAFDITLDPVIEEWGFDRKFTHHQIPSQLTIDRLLSEVGYQKLSLGEQCIKKEHLQLSINLSAIAKGFGVDEIAILLQQQGIENYLVEIGGETASKGINPFGKSWRLAIESPIEKLRAIQKIFLPLGLGVATSGDYRNYFEKNDIRYSHTIDPNTGRPIVHNLVSVTVLHKSTMIADAYATALLVMGKDKALEFAKKHKLAVYLLIKKDQHFVENYSDRFKKHLLGKED